MSNERLVAESRVAEGVWKGCFHTSPHCGSPVVTRVLAHCLADDVSPSSKSDASRLAKAISARSSYRKRPVQIGTLYLSVM